MKNEEKWIERDLSWKNGNEWIEWVSERRWIMNSLNADCNKHRGLQSYLYFHSAHAVSCHINDHLDFNSLLCHIDLNYTTWNYSYHKPLLWSAI